MELALVAAVVLVALCFDYTNGFHDAANAIATSISTRALTPRVALLLAAVMNFVGALLGGTLGFWLARLGAKRLGGGFYRPVMLGVNIPAQQTD